MNYSVRHKNGKIEKFPVTCDLEAKAWFEAYECGNRMVKKTEVCREVFVSTVFLGVSKEDWSLYESLVVGGQKDGERRISLEKEGNESLVVEAHDALVDMVRKAEGIEGLKKINDSKKNAPWRF